MKILIGLYILAWIFAISERIINRKDYEKRNFYEKNKRLIDSLNED